RRRGRARDGGLLLRRPARHGAVRGDRVPGDPPRDLTGVMAKDWSIRAARADDAEAIARVHTRSIRTLGRSHYTEDEVESWAAGLDPAFFRLALERLALFEVAVNATGAVVGIAAAKNDEVWLLYTDPDW